MESTRIKFGKYIVIIDLDKLEDVLSMKWHPIHVKNQVYLKHTYREGYKVKTIYLHKYISGYKYCGFKHQMENNIIDCRLENLYDKSKRGN